MSETNPINSINELLIERYKTLQEIQESQFKILKEKYEAELKLNIFHIQKESLVNNINDLLEKKDSLSISHKSEETKTPKKLVTKTGFNMQPVVSSKTKNNSD